MSVKPPEEHLLTASQIAGSEEFPLSHPLNPKSQIYLRRRGETVGRHIIFTADGMYRADSDKLKRMSFEAWGKKS